MTRGQSATQTVSLATGLALLLAVVLVNAAEKTSAQELAGLPPTYADVPYGPDAANVLDLWQAAGDGPRPLLVFIHGGGWSGSGKTQRWERIGPYLEAGISYASIEYRTTPEAPLPAPVHDAARAIQFLRSKAAEWNLDPARVALTGGSAGACTSMWLLLHDDLADPSAADPVLRQSTRVLAAAAIEGQVSIDPKVIEGWLGSVVLEHPMIYRAVGETSLEGALRRYDRYRDLYVEFSPYNHLSADDPPLFLDYLGDLTLPSKNPSHGIHHPIYGIKMKEKADSIGHETYLRIEGGAQPDKYADVKQFLLDKLLGDSRR